MAGQPLKYHPDGYCSEKNADGSHCMARLILENGKCAAHGGEGLPKSFARQKAKALRQLRWKRRQLQA